MATLMIVEDESCLLYTSKAKKLLKQTDKNSGEIAKAVGYKDSHYFSFVFKKLQGCSPREYLSLIHI